MSIKKNIIANNLGQIYVIIAGVVVTPFYLKYLGNEAFGLVGFFALMQSWLSILDMGMSPTLSREVAKVKNGTTEQLSLFKKLLHSLEMIFILLGLIVSILILLHSDWLSLNWLQVETLSIKDVSYCIKLMGVMIGLRWLGSLYRSGITGAEEQVWLNIANVIIITTKFLGVLLVLSYISTDVKHFFEYQVMASILELINLSTKFYRVMSIGRFKFFFSAEAVKPILPFAMGIAYVGTIWIFLTQLDKLILSNILPLKEYGYFALVGMIANAIIQVSNPISKAVLPRLVSLLHQGKELEMLKTYRKATQLMAVSIFSVVGVISIYSYELLYTWTGNIEASKWAKDILYWYVLGNGIVVMSAFQYRLQFAHGKIKMHVQYNTVSVLISIPLTIWAAYTYGPTGIAITWFVFRGISFLIWTPIVHNKFAPGLHNKWMLKDILPVLLSTILFLWMLKLIQIDFKDYGRDVIFSILITIGLGLLAFNSLVSSEGRDILLKMIKRKIKKC